MAPYITPRQALAAEAEQGGSPSPTARFCMCCYPAEVLVQRARAGIARKFHIVWLKCPHVAPQPMLNLHQQLRDSSHPVYCCAPASA